MKKETLWTKEFLLANGIQFGVTMGYFMLYSTIGIFARGLTSVEFYVGLSIGIFTLASLMTRFFSGRLLDRFPTKTILLSGMSISIVACVGYLMSHQIELLLAMRILNGLGYGLASAATATIISSMLPPKRLLEGLGYSMMVFTLCGAIGPSIALTLSHSDAERFGIVFVLTLLTAILTFAVSFLLPSGKKTTEAEPQQKTERVELHDHMTLATLVFTILTFLLAFGQSAVVACLNLYALDYGMGNLSMFFVVFAVFNCITRLFMNTILQMFSERVVLIVITGMSLFVYAGIFLAHQAVVLYLLAIPYGVSMGFFYPLLTTKTIRTMSKLRQGTSNSIYLGAEDVAFFLGAVFWTAISGVLGGYRQIYLAAAGIATVMLVLVLGYPALLKKYHVKEDVW